METSYLVMTDMHINPDFVNALLFVMCQLQRSSFVIIAGNVEIKSCALLSSPRKE